MRTWLPAVVAAVIAGAPAPAALANGPSAGDNQYTDPLAGQTTSHTTSTTHTTPPPAQTTSTPAATSPPATTPATSAPSPAPTAATGATGTTAVGAATGKADPKTLPLTGFDATLGAGVGFLLLGAGLLARRRALS